MKLFSTIRGLAIESLGLLVVFLILGATLFNQSERNDRSSLPNVKHPIERTFSETIAVIESKLRWR